VLFVGLICLLLFLLRSGHHSQPDHVYTYPSQSK
jgi:hypothetical protein